MDEKLQCSPIRWRNRKVKVMSNAKRNTRAIKGFTVRGWWMLRAAALYLQDVGEATSSEILANARSPPRRKGHEGSRIDLSTRALSGRLQRHSSFKSRKDGKNKSNPVLWRVVDDNIFLENPHNKNTRRMKEWKL